MFQVRTTMTYFLTSSPCDNNVPEGLDLPCIFDARNGFVENLRASVEPGAQLLIIASDPDAFAGNDEMAATFEGCFAAAEIELEDVCVLDSRNADDAAEIVAQSGVILLSGGHVPTENAFFASMDLRNLLADFDGVIGFSSEYTTLSLFIPRFLSSERITRARGQTEVL